MKQSLKFLKERITDRMSLEDMVAIFEDLCREPIDDEMISFEVGTFTSISDKPLFQFSLVRQVPDEDEEFYQVHLDIFYEASRENQIFSESTWDEDLEENIFTTLEIQKYLPMLESRNIWQSKCILKKLKKASNGKKSGDR